MINYAHKCSLCYSFQHKLKVSCQKLQWGGLCHTGLPLWCSEVWQRDGEGFGSACSVDHTVVYGFVALALSSEECFEDEMEVMLLLEFKEILLGTTVFVCLFLKGSEEWKSHLHVLQLYSLVHANLWFWKTDRYI